MIHNTVFGIGSTATARLLVDAPQGARVVASKGGKSVLCERKLVEFRNPEYLLPDGYTQLSHIAGEIGTSIDLGVVPTAKTVSKFKVQNNAATGDCIYGYQGDDNNDYRVFNYANHPYFDMGAQRLTSPTLGFFAGNPYEIEIGNYYFYGDAIGEITGTEQPNFQGVNTLKLNDGNSKNGWFWVTIIEDGVEIRRCIPCRRDSDNLVSMYDLAENRFVTAVTGTFTAGDVIPKTVQAYRYVGELNEYGLWEVAAESGGSVTRLSADVSEAADVFPASV